VRGHACVLPVYYGPLIPTILTDFQLCAKTKTETPLKGSRLYIKWVSSIPSHGTERFGIPSQIHLIRNLFAGFPPSLYHL